MPFNVHDLYRQINRAHSIKSDNELDINRFVEDRENSISDYISASVSHHKSRLRFKGFAQYFITFFLVGLIAIFGVAIICAIFLIVKGKITDETQIITILSCTAASFIASVFSLLQIIVKYLFPQTDDKIATDLMKTTLSSDLKLLNYVLQRKQSDAEHKNLSESSSKNNK